MPRTHFFSLVIALIFGVSAQAQLVINEYSAANLNTIQDNFSQYEDWVELYNPTGAAVDISGWYLSDKVTNPTKYQITSGSVPANGRLVIWLSNRNQGSGNNIHTNFKISQTREESILLSDDTGTLVDQIDLIPTQKNHSRGRSGDGGSDWTVFDYPTPNNANTVQVREYAQMPLMDQPAGFYSGSVSVSLSTGAGVSEIRYTLDGTTPTAASTLYSAPINITQTTVVRARAFNTASTDSLASFIETNTYFIDETHTVKVISVCGDDILTLLNGTQLQPEGTLELFESDGTFLDEAYGNFNEHGNDSWAYDQRGIDWIARDQYGYNKAIRDEIFEGKDRPEFQRLIIKAAASDNYPFENGGSHIRDAYVQSLSQIGDLRLDERSFEPAVMYANGQYWGVYDLREKVDDSDFTDYYYNQGEYDVQMVKTWGGTWAEYGGPQSINDWNTLRNFITSNDMSIQANYDSVKSQLNVGSLIDYFCLNSYVVCMDWLNWNTGWWRGLNPNGTKKKWRYILWDMDAVFGHYINYTGVPDTSPDADPCNAENLGNPGGQGHTEIMNALMASPEFEQEYVSRYIDLGNTVFSCEYMTNHLDSCVALIEPEMQRHCTRWGGSFAQWQNNVQDNYDFINDRCVAMNQGLVDCYEVEGPYEITYIVEPAGSPNTIKINSVTPDVPEYPFVGDFFGGIDLLLKAREADGWTFSHWESLNHTLSPGTDSIDVFTQLTTTDTIIAYFVEDSTILTVMVDPPNTGTVDLDGVTCPGYPYNQLYQPGQNIGISANAIAGWEFERWEAANHTINPSEFSEDGFFTINSRDTLWAIFREEPNDVLYRVQPSNGGTIAIDGTTPSGFPYADAYYPPTPVSLEATANTYFDFSHWEANNHVLAPNTDSDTVFYYATTTDTITAVFTEHPYLTVLVQPEGSGDVALNTQLLPQYPWSSYFDPSANVSVVATPMENWEFDTWQLNNHTIAPDPKQADGSFILTELDTLIAIFKPAEAVVSFPNIFTPNGDNQNDAFAALEYVNAKGGEMTIFDRWGRVFYRTSDLETGWDGTKNGRQSPAGTYYYMINYLDHENQEQVLTGYITLLR